MLARRRFRGRGILQRTPTRNASEDILNTALELPLPRTHFVARGGIPQRIHIRHCSTSLLLATAVKRARRRNVSVL